MVPDKPVAVDPTNITIRKVDLDDRVLQLFYQSFISGQHAYLLNQSVQEDADDSQSRRNKIKDKKVNKSKKKVNKSDKANTTNKAMTVNEVEERQQEIKEISEDITENMKYLVESKYTLQLKQQRKKKTAVLEQKQQEVLNKALKLGTFYLS